MKKVLLIIDERKEQLIKNKRLAASEGITVYTAESLKSGLEVFGKCEPDMIIISDVFGKDCEICISSIRKFSFNLRPVIVVLSKSDDLNDKIAFLEKGADDFFSEPLESGEFKARVNAHLRRHFETETDAETETANQRLSFVYLKRILNMSKHWAALLVGIDNFSAYKEIYGELAAAKMLKTFTAIAKTTMSDDDFIGTTGEGEFLVITLPEKAERFAKYLIYAFDSVRDKFYTRKDAENGFITLRTDAVPEKKIGNVSLSIGIISDEHRKISGVKQALNMLTSLKKTSEAEKKSSYVADRLMLPASGSVAVRDYNAEVLIMEPDKALSFLLETIAQMKGYSVKTADDFENVKDSSPAVIILDTGDMSEFDGCEICSRIKKSSQFEKSFIIMTSIIHDKEKVLKCGADMYVPKPYDTAYLFEQTEKAVKEYNS